MYDNGDNGGFNLERDPVSCPRSSPLALSGVSRFVCGRVPP